MNNHLYPTIIIFVIIYSIVNYYVGLRGWQGLRLTTSSLGSRCYQLIFGALTLAYPLARIGDVFFPGSFIDNLTLTGSLWLGTLYYLFLFTLVIDLLRFLNKVNHFLPQKLTQHSATIVTMVCCFTLLLISYGTWNARHPITLHYEITIPKAGGSLETLQVVMVSDIHLGNIVTNKQLTKLVNRINQLEPDIILLAGDTIDDKVDILSHQNVMDNFNRLQSKFGTYAILGNHEYFAQKPEVIIQSLEQSNVHVLRDQWSLIGNSFYLVGRDDLSKQRYTTSSRQNLGTIMAGIDHTLPILLLDHQPHSLQDGVEQGVDLQFSGHTHLGQLFPNSLITNKLYELDWGYLRKESMQVLVSCGIGTWGPPIRIGNHPEILNITIHFTPIETSNKLQ